MNLGGSKKVHVALWYIKFHLIYFGVPRKIYILARGDAAIESTKVSLMNFLIVAVRLDKVQSLASSTNLGVALCQVQISLAR